MNKKNLKQRLKNGETVIGTWNMIPSPPLVEAIGYGGFDFIVIDREHGPVSVESAENLVRASEGSGMSSIIRVPRLESHSIISALDIGAHGIQVPHISTKEEAEKVIEYAKYYPQGKRGFSPFTRAGRYGLDAKDHAVNSNRDTVIIVNVEGLDGIKNLSDIGSIPEIDVVFIGPYDLSQSLGEPGCVNDPEVIKHIKNSAKLIRDRGKTCGSFAKDMKYLDILLDSGVQYITYGVDSHSILQNYRDMNEGIKKRIADRSKDA